MTRLLERETLLAKAGTAIAAATAGNGGVLLLQGPAGIGKTELARAVCATAAARHMTVVAAYADELETDFPYAVLRQLLEPLLPRSGDMPLAGAATRAAQVLAGGEAGDLGTAMHALYWLVSDRAEQGPLLLLADDVQWADDASLAFLHYLARRVERLPVLLVLTERLADGALSQPLLTRIAAERACEVLRPHPLSSDAVATLAREAAATEPDPAFVDAVHAATGGNALLVRELLREVIDAGIPLTATGVTAVRELAPDAVKRLVQLRLSRLAPACTRVAQAFAVLGDGSPLRRVSQLSGVPVDEVAEAADVLAIAGLLTPAPPRGFTHPLLREGTLATIPAGERSMCHLAAARLLYVEHAPASAVGAQLLATEPVGETWVVDALRAAARAALADGVPRSAATHLARALAEGVDRPGVLRELGVAQAQSADPVASATLREARELATDSQVRAQVTIELARAISIIDSDNDAARGVLDDLPVGELEPALAVRVEAERLKLAIDVRRADTMPSFGDLRHLADGAGGSNDVILSQLAKLALLDGEPAEVAADLARRAVAAREDVPAPALVVLTCTDHFAEAERLVDEVIEEGRRLGNTYLFGVGTVWRGQVRFRQGRLAESEADFRLASDIIIEISESHPGLTFPNTFLADVLMERGELAEAERLLAAVVPDRSGHDRWFLESRARLRIAQRRAGQAVDDLASFRRMPDRFRGPCFLPWRSTLALALEQLGEHDEAVRVAGDEVRLARRQGAPRAIGVALRVRGVVTGDEADLRAAVETLERTPARLELAKALHALGAAIRRDRRQKEARDPLRRALEIAQACGATATAERAREDLAASGARPRRVAVTGVDALTPSERRVAALAAQRLSNREIAQSLFISGWTVAAHLTSVYQKLGIDGRDDLAAHLPGEAGETLQRSWDARTPGGA